jgi:AGCS family alanine or glycine:cation symporter
MVEVLSNYLDAFDGWMYTYLLLILLAAAGIYFTIRTKFVQFRLLKEAFRVITEKKHDEKGVSSFQSMMISTASRVGTGNIAGVSTAICLGGVGAVFWMWLMAILGGATAFIESTLAQVYKVKKGDEFRGGPAYYIQTALKNRKLGILFAIFLILCFAYGFNGLQSYNVSSAIEYYFPGSKIVPIVVGLVLAVLTAIVIFGGVKRIGFITSGLVPVMAILYIVMALIVVFSNLSAIPNMFRTIFEQAFDFKAIFGGFTGSCMMLGIKRGLFSNEAGMGSAPNAAASANVSHPAKQGLVQMLSVFLDTIVICSATALMLLLSGVGPTAEVAGMPYVQAAVNSRFGSLGILIITIAIFLFAFSSLVGNYYYTESNLRFIKDNDSLLFAFRCTAVVWIFIGAQMNLVMAWSLADILMGFMAIVNIFAIFFLGHIAIDAMQDYIEQKKTGKNPIFKASDIGLTDTECWK